MEAVNVVDVQVGDIAVVAQLTGRRDIGAATEHEDHPACPAEAPVARIGVVQFATKHIPIPGARPIEIVNRQYGIRSRDAHARILALDAPPTRSPGQTPPQRRCCNGRGGAGCRRRGEPSVSARGWGRCLSQLWIGLFCWVVAPVGLGWVADGESLWSQVCGSPVPGSPGPNGAGGSITRGVAYVHRLPEKIVSQ
jgi:hypothetical protein